MLSGVEEGNSLMLTRLSLVATLVVASSVSCSVKCKLKTDRCLQTNTTTKKRFSSLVLHVLFGLTAW